MSRHERRASLSVRRRFLKRENREYTDVFEPIPREEWPLNQPGGIVAAYLSSKFLVQVYAAYKGAMRLSICRTELDKNGDVRADISWDELQSIKSAVGYGDFSAVEIYPSDADVVNVANMRHLWVLKEPMPFQW